MLKKVVIALLALWLTGVKAEVDKDSLPIEILAAPKMEVGVGSISGLSFGLDSRPEVKREEINTHDRQGIIPQAEVLLSYKLSSNGEEVGGAKQRVSLAEDIFIAESSQIDVSGWWGKIKLKASLVEVYSQARELVSAYNLTRDGKTLYDVSTFYNNGTYRWHYRKIKKASGEELAQFNQLISVIEGDRWFDKASLLSSIKETLRHRTEKKQQGKIGRERFDTTSTFLPFFLDQYGVQKSGTKINVYDTEELKLSEQTLKYLGRETRSVLGTPTEVRHFALSEKKGEPTNIWLAAMELDGLSESASTGKAILIPYIVKLTAEDEDGPIEIVLNDLALLRGSIQSQDLD